MFCKASSENILVVLLTLKLTCKIELSGTLQVCILNDKDWL